MIPFVLALVSIQAEGQTVLHELLGEAEFDFLGMSVDDAGDVDGDGLDDVIVGLLGFNSLGPRALVYSGRTGDVIHNFPVDNLSNAAGAGDVDGDGFADLIVGDSLDSNSSGKAVVFSGATGAVLLTFNGVAADDHFGFAVDGAGDANGDGHADLIVGAPQIASIDPGAGYARLFSGLDGALLFEFTGDSAGDAFGAAVSGAGDLNADDRADVIVGIPGDADNGLNAGGARVFSGADGSQLLDLDGDSAGDRFGRSVSAAGDVNLDGSDDIFIGSPNDGTVGGFAGKAEVFSGLDGGMLLTFFGDGPSNTLGSAVSDAGDVNGDGAPDLIAGAEGGNFARVYSGEDGAVIFTTFGTANFGVAVGGGGDVNGDCLADVIAGDPVFEDRFHEQGMVAVVSLTPAPALAYCFGDGSATPCPCGNSSAPGAGEGCLNSGGRGARLLATGSFSVSADDLRMHACGLLSLQPALLFAGLDGVNNGNGAPFGDGLRCAGGGVRRLGVELPGERGGAHWGPGLGVSGGWGAGDTRRFQVWYRDPGGSPCQQGFNLTNGLELVLLP